eukprot:m.439960 g.439960  ORF g.439960 m.439960 type:complete len:113 (+) comp18448_c0_seq1:3162-3500(+)
MKCSAISKGPSGCDRIPSVSFNFFSDLRLALVIFLLVRSRWVPLVPPVCAPLSHGDLRLERLPSRPAVVSGVVMKTAAIQQQTGVNAPTLHTHQIVARKARLLECGRLASVI